VDRGEKMGNFEAAIVKKFIWKCQYAVRVKKKSRIRGRIITGIRKELEEISVEEMKAIDGIQEKRFRLWR